MIFSGAPDPKQIPPTAILPIPFAVVLRHIKAAGQQHRLMDGP